MLDRSIITYICLLGLSGSAIAMDAPLRSTSSPTVAQDHDLSLVLNTIYEIAHEIATDLHKSLQNLRNAKPKVALKLNLSHRVAVLNDLVERLPNSLAKLKQALQAFGKTAIAYDMASNSALISECITHYQAANELLCQTIETLDEQKAECILCFDDKNIADFITLSCGHEYCKGCLQELAATAIKDKKAPCCPDPRCKKPLEYADIRTINSSRQALDTFNDIKLKEWLVSQNVKQCPTVNCSGAFISERDDQFTHKCKECKKEYCGQCLAPHDGRTSTCAQAKAERDLAANADAANRASEQWKAQNTKFCPRCNTSIQKTEGCNHMTCSQCRHEFCWNCLNNWRGHGYCGADRAMPAQPVQNQNARQQPITRENEHILFAGDPHGYVNHVLDGRLRGQDIAERFLALTCDQQNEWVAKVTEYVRNNQNRRLTGTVHFWMEALTNLEPFRIRIQSLWQEDQGQNIGALVANRPMNDLFIEEFTQLIGMQNPNDMILINNSNSRTSNGLGFETSLSREQFQAALNRASAHFRNYNFEKPAAPASTLAQVVPNIAHNDAAVPAAVAGHNHILHQVAQTTIIRNGIINVINRPAAVEPNPDRNAQNTTVEFTFRLDANAKQRLQAAIARRHGPGRLDMFSERLANDWFTLRITSNRLNAAELNDLYDVAWNEMMSNIF